MAHIFRFLAAGARARLPPFAGAHRLQRWLRGGGGVARRRLPPRPALCFIELTRVELAPAQLRALHRALPGTARTLLFGDNGCPHMHAFASSRRSALALRTLALGSLPLYTQRHTSCNGLAAVPRCDALPRLRVLRLSAVGATDQGVGEELARQLRAGALPALHTLHLDRNHLRRAPALIVKGWTAQSPRGAGRAGVRELELGYNEIGGPHLAPLLHALAGQPLVYLGLGNVGWDEPFTVHPLMDFFCDCVIPMATTLRELVLECNEIGLPAIERLVHACLHGGAPALRILDCGDNHPTYQQTRRLEGELQRRGVNSMLCCGL